MNPDELKQAWQASARRLTIDADVLLKTVQRNARDFNRTIFWRDVREAGGSLLMVPLWFYLGPKFSLPWTWYLGVPGLLWIAGFMIVDRLRQKKQQPRLETALGECIVSSLAQVEHQIWLLRNVLWWYLLPVALPILAFFAQVSWQARVGGWWTVLIFTAMVVFEVVVLGWVYWLNQHSIQVELEPRRQELRALRESLKDSGSLPD